MNQLLFNQVKRTLVWAMQGAGGRIVINAGDASETEGVVSIASGEKHMKTSSGSFTIYTGDSWT